MTILNRSTHRKVGLAVLLPAAVLVAAMVPALAAVYPSEPTPRSASPDVQQILAEMRATEALLEPHLELIGTLEAQIEPHLEMIEQIELDIDHEALEALELKMQPYLERIDEINAEMEPLHGQLEALQSEIENRIIHVEDGTLEEIQRQIQDQMELHHEQMEGIHEQLEPYLEQIESVHTEMEELHVQMDSLHRAMEPQHEVMERLHEKLNPFHEQMERVHREMEPIHTELERLGDRLETAITVDVEAVLREYLGSVTDPGTPFKEAAKRITEDAHVYVRDDVVKVEVSRGEARQILSDLFAPHRVGSQDNFNAATEDAVDALSPLVISVD